MKLILKGDFMVKSKINFLIVMLMVFLVISTSCKTSEITGTIKKTQDQKKTY